MFQKYFFIANYLLIILVGGFYFYKIKDSKPLWLFFLFLIYSLITEILGAYFWHGLNIPTGVIYNMWGLVSFLFYSYFFFNYIKSPGKQFVVKLFVIIGFILFIVNALFFQNIQNEVFRYNNMVTKILLSITVLMYFEEILKSNLILNFKKSMPFWIALATFIYALVMIPILVIGELIGYSGVFRVVIVLLNIIMSICFITGFVVSKKEFNT